MAPDQYHIQTNTYLSDRSADGMRTYAELKTYSRNGSIPLIPVDFYSRVCMDKSFAPDPCATGHRHQGP